MSIPTAIRPRNRGLSNAKAVLTLRALGLVIGIGALSALVSTLGRTAAAIADSFHKQFLPKVDYISRFNIAVEEAWDWTGIAWWCSDNTDSILLSALGALLTFGRANWLRWMLRHLEGVPHE